MWEIASMLAAGRAETIPKSKSKHMLEHQPPHDLEVIESPRILNSHLNKENLPTQIFEKRLKIIHVLRNPKDMLVSFYNHVKGINCYGYNGKWENFFKLFLKNERKRVTFPTICLPFYKCKVVLKLESSCRALPRNFL